MNHAYPNLPRNTPTTSHHTYHGRSPPRLDGSVHLLEPHAADSLFQIWPHPAAPPPESLPPFADPRRHDAPPPFFHTAHSVLFVGAANLLLSSFEVGRGGR